ncbi:15923_t:CDS:2 [Cetraspora pellucida]|uniref:15923_t:CDS:1 n=1 Tax=Cetraspora pellucida TaxID=1433469 RepID=A0A9N9C0Y8_9GLOM|nr:15923_t:CDS:2 [Cetraspora pellucida]
MGNTYSRRHRHKSDNISICTSVNGDNSSQTDSISSNVRYIGGRPYFEEEISAYVVYWEEADRIQMEHFAMKHAFGGNYAAPLSEIIKPGSKILDIGCGPAQEFPEANVYGIDISSTFPASIKPKNCHFKKCNIVEPFPFKDEEFDYVFMRYMIFALKDYQWIHVLNEIKRILKPGGVFECVDRDVLREYNKTAFRAGKTITAFVEKSQCTLYKQKGIDVRFITKVEPTLKEMGFQNVTCIQKHIPFGNWGGKIGEIWKLNNIKMAETQRILMPEILGITVDEWDSTYAQISKEREENQEFDSGHQSGHKSGHQSSC